MTELAAAVPGISTLRLRFVAAATALAFVLVGTLGGSSTAEAAGKLSTYSNEEFGIAFQYPKSWKISVDSDTSFGQEYLWIDLTSAKGTSMASLRLIGDNGSGGTCDGTINVAAFGAKNVSSRIKPAVSNPAALAGLFYISKGQIGINSVKMGILSVTGKVPKASKWTKTLPCDTQTSNPVVYLADSQLHLEASAIVPSNVTTLAKVKKYSKASAYRAQLKFLKSIKLSGSDF
jgi:hypothetical protein